jgi:hypothetical protein
VYDGGVDDEKQAGEEAVAAAWARLGAGHAAVTQEGERLQVRFTGQRNSGAGPDFRGAIIQTERGRLVRGDVEVHRTAAGWEAHGHGADARYRRVVLHVVGADDRGHPAALPGGGHAPVLVLSDAASGRSVAAGCHPEGPVLDGAAAVTLLERLGRARFERRVRAWRRRLARRYPDAALTEALLRALGNGHDPAPFERLGKVLTWPAVAAAGLGGGPESVQALVLGTAGLLGPGTPAAAPLVAALLPHWHAAGFAACLAPRDWPRAGCRPNAAAWRRLGALGTLLARWAAPGPAAALEAAAQGLPAGRWAPAMRAHFSVQGEPVGCSIGPERAATLAVDLALPYLAARGATAAVAAYLSHPALAPDAVTRRLAAQLGLSGLRAVHQQGLHELHRGWCRRGRQQRCPLAGDGVSWRSAAAPG